MIGDCWLFGAMAGIAEYPERIKKIFVNQELTPSGIYQVKMWYKGQPHLVNLDDSLAVDKYGRPVSGKQGKDGGSWWNALLEKAMAKFNVNYLQL